MDMGLFFNKDTGFYDLKIDDDIVTDGSLKTAVIISLYSDARHENKRGFWAEFNDEYGAKLWTLEREKVLEETRLKYEDYAKSALNWMIVDKLVKETFVSAAFDEKEKRRINLKIILTKPDNTKEVIHLDDFWGI